MSRSQGHAWHPTTQVQEFKAIFSLCIGCPFFIARVSLREHEHTGIPRLRLLLIRGGVRSTDNDWL